MQQLYEVGAEFAHLTDEETEAEVIELGKAKAN